MLSEPRHYAATVALAALSFAMEASAQPYPGAAFVQQLRQAAAQPGGAALADLTQLPFLFEGRPYARDAFINRVVPALFTADVRQCLRRTRAVPEGDRLVLWCRPYTFYLGQVRDRWRLVEFSVDTD